MQRRLDNPLSSFGLKHFHRSRIKRGIKSIKIDFLKFVHICLIIQSREKNVLIVKSPPYIRAVMDATQDLKWVMI